MIDQILKYYCHSCLFGNVNLEVRPNGVGREGFKDFEVVLLWDSRTIARNVPLDSICKNDSVLKYIRYPSKVDWEIIKIIESGKPFNDYDAINAATLKNRVIAKDTQFVKAYLSYLREFKRTKYNSLEFLYEKMAALSEATRVYPKMYSSTVWEDNWEDHKVYIEWYYKEGVFDQLFQYYVNSCLFGNTNLKIYVHDSRKGYFNDISVSEINWGKSHRKFPSGISLQDICKSDTVLQYIEY